MEYIYSLLLLHRAGKAINEENIKRVLEASGFQADESRIKALIAALEGVDIAKILEKAMTVQTVAPQEAKKEEKKEEAKEEKKSSEEAAVGLGALFG